jgi:cytochrome b subunit of formate dehydrogenase
MSLLIDILANLDILACFLIGFLVRQFWGNGLRSFVCILTLTAIVFVVTNLRIVKELGDTHSILAVLFGILFWYLIPYFIFSLVPAIVGALAQPWVQKLWKKKGVDAASAPPIDPPRP